MSSLELTMKELRADRAATEKRLATINRAMEALEALKGEGSDGGSRKTPTRPPRRAARPHNTLGPRGVEAVDKVLKEQGRRMTTREVLTEIQRKGWIKEGAKSPMEATRVALRRLQDRGGAKKVADGRWITLAEPIG